MKSHHYDLQTIQQGKIRIARDLNTWANLPEKTGASILIPQNPQVKKTSLSISSIRQNTSNASHLQRPSTIPHVLAKLAEQSQISYRSSELGSKSEELEGDFDSKKINEFVDEEELVEKQQELEDEDETESETETETKDDKAKAEK